jgi:hypothetical protein
VLQSPTARLTVRAIVQEPAPDRPIDRGLAGPGLQAHMLVAKCADHLPMYRQTRSFSKVAKLSTRSVASPYRIRLLVFCRLDSSFSDKSAKARDYQTQPLDLRSRNSRQRRRRVGRQHRWRRSFRHRPQSNCTTCRGSPLGSLLSWASRIEVGCRLCRAV